MEIRRPAQDDPLQRFLALLERAKATPQIVEPTAMTLATVSAGGHPSARVVLLKDADEDGLVFYTNLDSRKGREALARPDVALLFWWGPLESQVRFEGRAERVGDDEADAYFATRARGSQLGAWASAQSRPIGSRAELEAKLAEVTEKFEGMPVPRPPHWSGLRVKPLSIEFWRNRPNRLHERELYTREKPGAPWSVQLLNP
ncbi:MAG TPA: pyridoxamine 5'-phosphate oxidase [Myxococcales bacterium]|jgi:pyridoxamine 5'-phosphate oxidase|nr:pyridoxamine 5'-phosphate oxidase [Myxococcales bacterium]